jgi:hypothetical protein
MSSLWRSALLIDPESRTALGWSIGLVVVSLLIGLHVSSAYWRGGRLRHFLLPVVNPMRVVRRLRRGGLYAEARDRVWNFITALRLPYYFSLGLRGFLGSLVWLIVPVSLLALGRLQPIVGFVGAFFLLIVLLYLPFLQTRFAATGSFSDLFAVRQVRRMFTRAPVVFFVALAATVVLALPLYFLKIEMIPREAAWLPSLVFVVFMFPARLLSGWACARAERRDTRRHWLFRYSSRLAMLPVAALYVLALFFTQHTSWHGVWSLYEQHAFLVPVPFLSM